MDPSIRKLQRYPIMGQGRGRTPSLCSSSQRDSFFYCYKSARERNSMMRSSDVLECETPRYREASGNASSADSMLSSTKNREIFQKVTHPIVWIIMLASLANFVGNFTGFPHFQLSAHKSLSVSTDQVRHQWSRKVSYTREGEISHAQFILFIIIQYTHSFNLEYLYKKL